MVATVGHGEGDGTMDISKIRAAIPAKCFKPSLMRSMAYVVRDLVLLAGMFYLSSFLMFDRNFLALPALARAGVWGLYSYIQGLFFTGIWILAHECGHNAFSTHLNINAVMGYILHTLVLVPFFSWKFSHARHHRYANHMEKDTVFVPSRKEEFRASFWQGGWLKHVADEHGNDIPIVNFALLIFHQLMAWPFYMLSNASAGARSLITKDKSTSSRQSHMDPGADIFTDSERPYVFMSVVGVLAVLGVLAKAASIVGVWNVVLAYGLPYLWMNHWLIAITFLHHTHPDAPHYDEGTWNYRDGALSTIDREFGFIGKHFFHGIIEFHVVHHLFPRIPFYYAEEATEAIKPLLGKKYLRQETSFLGDLWKTFSSCRYVEGDASKPGHLTWARTSTK